MDNDMEIQSQIHFWIFVLIVQSILDRNLTWRKCCFTRKFYDLITLFFKRVLKRLYICRIIYIGYVFFYNYKLNYNVMVHSIRFKFLETLADLVSARYWRSVTNFETVDYHSGSVSPRTIIFLLTETV